MALVLWGIDLKAAKWIRIESEATKLELCVPPDTFRAWWFDESEPRPWDDLYEGPAFDFVTIELDRWIVPWKVKAGYNAAINMLCFRLAGEL